ncbi:MAG: glycosyltransferase [Cyanophyceae cyanobacterium]
MTKLPPIYFYIPSSHWIETLPAADDNWQGFGLGVYAWTLQTYLRLRAEGFPCTLVQEFPEEGIVLAHRNSLRSHPHFQPGRNLLLVCLKADVNSHPAALLHVVQNPLARAFGGYYMPHWTQPGLIPRHPERGDRFENIAFFGHADNLVAELQHPAWFEQLHRLGLNWQAILNRNHWNDYHSINNCWNDYSTVDAVIAVRSFKHRRYVNKPATKLYNAWLAGVPAILGCESAYRAERRSELDYLEVSSLEGLITALQRLRDDTALRRAMAKNGQVRAQAVQPSSMTARWRNFLTKVAVPTYYRWCSQPDWIQQLQLARCALAFNRERVQSKMRSHLQAYH